MTEPLTVRVHRFVEAQAARTPDACAVTCGHETLTYGALIHAANRLSWYLRSHGVGADVLVGICLGRTLEAVVAVLAVLKAGGTYLPLDPAYPADRLAYMLENSGARLLIADGTLEADWAAGITIIRPGDGSEGASEADFEADAGAGDSDPLAYVIYTSGSTGRPKGVAMPHGPLANLLRWQAGACPLAAGRKVLQFAPLSFDVSFQEIFSTLGEGGTLALIPEELRRDPRGLLRFLAEEDIGRVFLPPVMLYQLAEQFVSGGTLPGGLREVITAGEALRITPAVVKFFAALEAHGGCVLHNHYGPTETHVVTACTLEGEPEHWPALPSIGRPIDGVEIRLLDEAGQAVKSGEPGALYLGGNCLARGYLHDRELTDARFVWLDGGRWYKTGDLALAQPDGNLQFFGRADDQVKIRGFRVELGEVEAVLARHPAIRETAVGVMPAGVDGGQELVGYFVPRDAGSALAAADLRRWLLGQLPDYLVPTRFAALAQLPLTPSGKLDRRALPHGRAARAESTPAPANPPRTALEKTVARAWEETLGISGFGVRDNFFEAGGNSLHAVRVHTKLCQVLGREFPVTAIFQHPTVAALAAHLGTEHRAAGVADSIQDRARRQQQQHAATRARLADSVARRAG